MHEDEVLCLCKSQKSEILFPQDLEDTLVSTFPENGLIYVSLIFFAPNINLTHFYVITFKSRPKHNNKA